GGRRGRSRRRGGGEPVGGAGGNPRRPGRHDPDQRVAVQRGQGPRVRDGEWGGGKTGGGGLRGAGGGGRPGGGVGRRRGFGGRSGKPFPSPPSAAPRSRRVCCWPWPAAPGWAWPACADGGPFGARRTSKGACPTAKPRPCGRRGQGQHLLHLPGWAC